MTEQERAKLVEEMTDAMEDVGDLDLTEMAHAALAIAERAIRKDCAQIVKKAPAVICDDAIDYARCVKKISAAILASIPEKNDD